MDKYTQEVKIWLDTRFKACDESGIYIAHQPIYGFWKGYCEPHIFERYIRIYHIMKALSEIKYESLLDVGGAEGYKAYIAQQLFGGIVKNSDLSEEACKRAEEIFGIESIPIDIHDMPFENNEFDVILCSETLEHVEDLQKAIAELMRVAGKAVVITVPYESKDLIEKNIKEKKIHEHIHNFEINSFDFLVNGAQKVIARKISSQSLMNKATMVEPLTLEQYEKSKLPKPSFFKKCFAKRLMGYFIQLDNFLCKYISHPNALLFIILKNENCHIKEKFKISGYQILCFEVPYHYINKDG